MASIGTKQRVFIEHYLRCWNATEAARLSGYKHPNKQGPRLLVNVGIREAIDARIKELTMSADEVLIRLTEHGRGDIGAFMKLSPDEIKTHPDTRLIKEYERHVTTGDGYTNEHIKLKLYDAQAALLHLWKHHRLAKGEATESVDISDAKQRLAQLLARQDERTEPGDGAGDADG